MWPNPQETAHWITFTEEILNEKLFFFVQWQLLLMFCILKKKKIYPSYVSNHKSWKASYFFNDLKQNKKKNNKKKALSCSKKTLSIIKRNYIKKIMVKNKVGFFVWTVLTFLEQKTNLNHMKSYVKINIFVMKLWLLKKIKY